jgi:hypothetical protein
MSTSSADAARVVLDLRATGRLPADITRPEARGNGDFVSPALAATFDIVSIHSDWPPGVDRALAGRPYPRAYGTGAGRVTVRQIGALIEQRGHVVVLDTRNADQAAIDDLHDQVLVAGWADRVLYYP